MWAAAATFLAYFALLLYCDLARPQKEGFEVAFDQGQMVVGRVEAGSPAARAGLEPGDVVARWNGQALTSRLDLTALETNIEFGRPIDLVVFRDGSRIERRLVLEREAVSEYSRTPAGASLLVVRAVQLVTLGLGLFLAFRRPRQPAACVGGWLLATAGVYCVVPPYRLAAVWRSLPSPAAAALWPPLASDLVLPAILLTFFLLVPVRKARRWWAWAAAWAPMLLAAVPEARWYWRLIHDPDRVTGAGWAVMAPLVVGLGYVVATVAVILRNYRGLEDTTERRRLRVLLVGTALGCGAGALVSAFFWLSSTHVELLGSPAFILGTFSVLATPLAFTYAVLRHRLFDVTVIVRQGVRYAVARNALLSVVPAVLILLAADLLVHRDDAVGTVFVQRAWIYAALAAVAVAAHRFRAGWLAALDRRFFRERYDASRLLRQLAEDLQAARDLDRAAASVVNGVETALHPRFVTLLVCEPGASACNARATSGGQSIAPIPRDNKVLDLVRVVGKPVQVPPPGATGLFDDLPADEMAQLRTAEIEMLVPVAGTPDGSQAVLALGLKRSEEPYSREDRELLAAIAGSLALLLGRPAVRSPAAEETVAECPACGRCHDRGNSICDADGSALVEIPVPRLLAGRYRLERRLGSGGMGTVYEALDGELGRTVAVKLLREHLAGSAEAAERFRQEARAAAAFAHPNVVTVHDYGVAAGRAFLVMELLEGITLRQALTARGSFPPAETLAILRGVVSAVAAAHERSIVHRDLKPENIVLVEASGSRSPKVLDFGLAKFVGSGREPGGAGGASTGVGVLLGTLPYMAPEQLRGEEVAPAWDLWALAVIACEMLIGRHPFALVFTGDAMPAAQVSLDPISGLSRASRDFLARALDADLGRRPATARLFLADLEAALTTE